MKKLGRFLFWTAFLGMALLLGLVSYVMTLGIPGPIVRHYADVVERSQGLRIRVERVQWSPWHHVTASGIRVSVPGRDVNIAFRRLDIDIRSRAQLTGRGPTVRCHMSDGCVQVAGGEGQSAGTIHLARFDLLDPFGETPHISLDGTLRDGWHVSVTGTIRNVAPKGTQTTTLSLGERIADAGARFRGLLHVIDGYDRKGLIPGTVTARATVEIDAGDVRKSTACGFLDGGPVRLGSATPNPCSAALQWSDGVVRVDSLRIGTPGSGWSIDACGTIDPTSGTMRGDARLQATPSELVAAGILSTNHAAVATLFGPLDLALEFSGDIRDPGKMRLAFRASSSSNINAQASMMLNHAQGRYSNGMLHVQGMQLSTDAAAGCLRAAPWADWLARAQLGIPGILTLDAAFGPAPLGTIHSNITGRLTCDAITYRDTTLKHVAVSFRRRGNDVHVPEATAFLVGEEGLRSVRGHGTLSDGGAFNVCLQTDVEPRQLAPFCPTNIAVLMASAAVGGSSHIELEIARTDPAATALTIQGVIHATDVTRNDVLANLVHASFAYSNHTLRVENLALVHGGGLVAGDLRYALADGLLSLNVLSTAPPQATAQFVDSNLERMVSPYRMEGPITIAAEGSIGMGENPTRDLRLHVEGRRLGWRWFLADQAVLDIAIEEQSTILRDIHALWCGGGISGSMRFDPPVQTNATGRCDMDLHVNGVDLPSAIDVFVDIEDRKAYEGTVSGQFVLSGATGESFMNTAVGTGHVSIKDGYILSIPLFGGLSKHLSLLIPGLGYASQRDLKADFSIQDGRIEATDAILLGKLISVRGRGSYGFDNDLDVRVQVQFLKEGITATVTRFLTSPLTKALEFELTGTTKEPRWRPANTPDRLLRFFAETLGGLLPETRAEPPEEPVPENL